MSDQFEQVRPLEGISSREHKDRDLQVSNLVNKVLSLCCAEFHRVTLWLSGGTAMNTSQIAGLCHLPDRDEWALVEINCINERVHRPIKPQSRHPAQ
jgi:hypothetical protein